MKEKKKKEEEVQEGEEGEKEEEEEIESRSKAIRYRQDKGLTKAREIWVLTKLHPQREPAAEANRPWTAPLNSIYHKLWIPYISQNTDTACPSNSWWSLWVPSAGASH